MNAVSTELMATLVAPNTWCSMRVHRAWKIKLDAPDRKKAR
jgi:hypothetical protein